MENEPKKMPESFRSFKSDLTVNSPGRINFIGEHTDYNDGFVLPAAIDKSILLDFANNDSVTCNIYSETNGKMFSFDPDNVTPQAEQWENYILGVVAELKKRGRKLRGFDCIIKSNLPAGAGISSSAALECGVAFGLNKLFNLQLSLKEIAELSRDAEHNFVGTNCGIMDQYASVMSRAGHLMLLDCSNFEKKFIKAEFGEYKIVLLNTMVSHSLAGSEYNTRRNECIKLVQKLQKFHPSITSLRDVNSQMLEAAGNDLPEVLLRRGKYVVNENQRVLQAVEALHREDLKTFGELMYKSHEGLQKNYEVSCRELDFMVDFSRNHDDVIGSRMMGGGFGGCTINLIHENKLEDYLKVLSEAYRTEFGIEPEAILVIPGGGTTSKFSQS